jgi:RNA polymerase sigma-70 factor, ECF subfamily
VSAGFRLSFRGYNLFSVSVRRDASSPEAAWVDGARRGDAVAFGELYRRYLGDVRGFCSRRIGDPIRAEDLAQDTFVRAFEQMGSFRHGAPFWPWLSTIARNLCIDELRQRGRVAEEITADHNEARDAALDPTLDAALAEDASSRIGAAVSSAMGKIPERERALLWSHTVDELSWSEIAARHHTSLHAARNAAWRARRALRSILAESLKDLRAGLPLPLLSAFDRLRRTGEDLRARLCAGGICFADALCQRVADVILATVVLTLGVSGGSAAGPVLDLAQGRASTHALASAPAPTVSSRAGGGGGTTNVLISHPSAKASIASASRPNAAAPATIDNRIEIRGPDGSVLYSSDTRVDCGDGSPSTLLPSAGPVRAYC